MKRKCSRPTLAALLLAGTLCGCIARDTVHVYLAEIGGLDVGSPVQYGRDEIGTVHAIQKKQDRALLDIKLAPDQQDRIIPGMRARPARRLLELGKPVLKIYGKPDRPMPLFPIGANVPDGIVFRNPFLNAYTTTTVLVVAGILVVLLAFKGLRKVLGLLLLVAIAAGLFFFLQSRWDEYKEVLQSTDLEKKLDRLAEKTVRSPDAVEAWELTRESMAEMLGEAKSKGGAALEDARETLCGKLEEKAGHLRDQGKKRAAEELERLRDRIRQEREAEVDEQ